MINIPNLICILRILLIVPIVFLTLDGASNSIIIAMVLFIIASLSDALDGYIARKHNLVTNLGKLLDPLADKLLVLSVFITFLVRAELSIVFVLIVLARELTITGLRSIAASSGLVIQASIFGKLKTISQMLVIIALYLSNIVTNEILTKSIPILILLAGILTVFSALDYVYKSKHIFKS